MRLKTGYSKSILAILFISMLTSCKNETAPTPTILGFTSSSGSALSSAAEGTVVVIVGANFSPATTGNEVKFNGVAANISASTSTQLTTIVPTSATTGKVTVTVNGLTATSAVDFEVLIDIPRNGLIAFYPFSGNANDASGNNLNGTLTNGPILSADRFGKANHAYSFDGINDFVEMDNPMALQIKGKITLSVWGNANSFVDPPNLRFVGNPLISKFEYTGTAPTQGYYFTQGYGIFTCYSVPATENRILKVEDGSLPSANTWIHFVLVFDGGSWRYYKNGSLVYSETVFNGNILDNGSYGNFRIGVLFGGSTYYYKGSIDDVAVYNRALLDEEIVQLYQQTITKN